MTPLRAVLYDRTCGALTVSWAAGVALYRARGLIDAAYGARTWAKGLEWLASIGGDRPLGHVQYWGHGLQGQVLLAKEALGVDAFSGVHAARLAAMRERMAPDATWWFRTCLTFGGVDGHRFARAWTEALQRPVAGHTWVIGPIQAGLHLLRPGETPTWPLEEGDAGHEKGRVPDWLRADAPRRITCLQGRLPDWA